MADHIRVLRVSFLSQPVLCIGADFFSKYQCDMAVLFSICRLCNAGLQTISRLALVKFSGQIYFCLDISHFWPI